MKTALVLLTATLLGTAALAADTKRSEPAKDAVKKEKRTKKVEMCAKCGKPESKCDCPDEKHEHEDTEKGTQKEEKK